MQSIGRKEFQALRQQHPEAFKAMQRVVRWKAIKLLLLDAYHARLASELQARIKGIEATPPGQSYEDHLGAPQVTLQVESSLPEQQKSSNPLNPTRWWVQDAGGWI